MAKLIRITTVPLALRYLLTGQMRYMKEHGLDVIMVSADGNGREDLEQQEGCRHHIIPMTRKITPFADLRSLWLLYRFFRKEKPDLVHSHTPKAGLLAMLAAKMAGVKIRIHTIAGLRFMTAEGMTRRLLIFMEKLTAMGATNVWPNSFSLLEYVKKNKLVASYKVEVIGLGSSNGINLSRFSLTSLNSEQLQEAKNTVNYDPQLIYLLCVGRIVKDKGIHELIAAFAAAYRNNSLLRLILIGPFEDELDPVSDEVRKVLQTHPAIILTGWKEDIEYFMSFSFALIHASYREGFPNVLLQAGAMLCPVICSKIEGNIDIIENEKTGLLFEVRNEKELLHQLERALADPRTIQHYARQLREKIERYFDQQVVQEHVRKRYIELLGKNP